MGTLSQTVTRGAQLTDQGAGGADEAGATINNQHGWL